MRKIDLLPRRRFLKSQRPEEVSEEEREEGRGSEEGEFLRCPCPLLK